jgi:hypothetical protein
MVDTYMEKVLEAKQVDGSNYLSLKELVLENKERKFRSLFEKQF